MVLVGLVLGVQKRIETTKANLIDLFSFKALFPGLTKCEAADNSHNRFPDWARASVHFAHTWRHEK